MNRPKRNDEATIPSASHLERGQANLNQRITAIPTAVPVKPPPRIGDYEILGELGRGGMGVVYKASQAALGRLVALKMVLEGRVGPEALTRFRAEAVAVARLKHPNIVQIYDVGAEQGRPYFSLEFVDGGSLAQQIAGQPQPTRHAAQVIETLARAMDYAHQQGIVHRDLKPGNILLASDGTPKITDFGLAKHLESTDSDTKTGAILGTPSYIAPEQAVAKKDVGPPADIYALGAILYEMLTGRPPFKGETPMDTMLQVVSDEVVPPTLLNMKVPRDLETICLRCLQKEPAKRYRSAGALADDLHRFQAGEAITARPVGTGERFWRWCRRRPAVAALLLTVMLVTGFGMAGVFWQWRRAEANFAEAVEQRQRAEALLKAVSTERDRARKDYEQARQIVDDFFVKISDDNMRRVPGMQAVRKEFLEAALRYYQGFLHQHADDASLRTLLAETHYNVGKVALEIGKLTDAEKAFRKALGVYKELLAAQPADRKLKRATATCWIGLARTQARLQRNAEAADLYARAGTLMEELVRTATVKDEGLEDLLFVYDGIGQLRRSEEKRTEALAAYEKGRTLLHQLMQSEATSTRQWKLAIFCKNCGELYADLRQPDKARAALREALALLEPLARGNPQRADLQAHLALLYVPLAQLAHDEGKTDEMFAHLDHARQILERVARENPAVASFRADLAATVMTIGEMQLEKKQAAEAIRMFDQARTLREGLCREEPTAPRYQELLAAACVLCGRARVANGQVVEARACYAQAQTVQEQLVRNHPDVPTYKNELAGIVQEAKSAQAKRAGAP
jgi:serine/threonine-protein kinase